MDVNNYIETCDEDILLDYIIDFNKLYDKRPIKNNDGGMKSPHMFWVFLILKLINPLVVIESGIFKGQSTWLIENTCPNAKIISIDPNMNQIIYKSKKADYRTKDFNSHNWSNELGIDTCLNTLAFIDDHQNNYDRLKHAYNHKIGHVIFEDNYPTTKGDVLSLKKILSDNYHILDVNGKSLRYPIPEDYKSNVLNMCNYSECPPIFLDSPTTRWGDSFKEHNCKQPVVKKYKKYVDYFKNEQLDYTFIAYVKVNILH